MVFGKLRRRLLGRREISPKFKMKISNAVVLLPVPMYGTTSLALTQTEEGRLYVFKLVC